MAVDAPAYILKTIDGGETWKIVYENKTDGMFLDAMEFWNEAVRHCDWRPDRWIKFLLHEPLMVEIHGRKFLIITDLLQIVAKHFLQQVVPM